jgi:RimJ/RimL family protein N-acetyltransferase
MLPMVTTRLAIRPLRETDFDALHAVYSDAEVVRYIPGGVRDEKGSRQRLEELIAHHEQHGVSKWAVTLASTGHVIGDCGLQFLPGTTDLELGFHLARPYWGRGYATEAASACLQWALVERRERIVAIVDPAHAASQRILSKIGMRPVGPGRFLDRSWLVYEAVRSIRASVHAAVR